MDLQMQKLTVVMWTLPPFKKLYIYSQRNLTELNLLTAMRIVTEDVSQEVTPAKKFPLKELSEKYLMKLHHAETSKDKMSAADPNL